MTHFLLHPCLLTVFADFIGTFNTEILYWVISDPVAGGRGAGSQDRCATHPSLAPSMAASGDRW